MGGCHAHEAISSRLGHRASPRLRQRVVGSRKRYPIDDDEPARATGNVNSLPQRQRAEEAGGVVLGKLANECRKLIVSLAKDRRFEPLSRILRSLLGGETQLELDRRRIRTRMAKLRRDIKRMGPARHQQRAERRRTKTPSAVVVGYTNAGKSSLLNRLTGAGVLVENALFATLDPTVRRAQTFSGREYTLTDTVGFVRQLPTQLVEAFRSTLEEAGEADLLIHVVDSSHHDPAGQVRAVREVLSDVPGTRDAREIVVLSKADLASPVDLAALRSLFPGAVAVSCLTGQGIDELRAIIEEALPLPEIEVALVIPYSAGGLLSRIYDEGELLAPIEYRDEGTFVHARISPDIESALHRKGVMPRREDGREAMNMSEAAPDRDHSVDKG